MMPNLIAIAIATHIQNKKYVHYVESRDNHLFCGILYLFFIKRVQYCFNVKLSNKLTSKYLMS